MKKNLIAIAIINLILFSSFSFAAEKIALNYNIMPEIPNGYVVDANHINQIGFSLFEKENELFCNETPLIIENNKFKISIDNLSGECKFIINNLSGESVQYTYYISDDDGYLNGYQLEELSNVKHKVYITTVKNVSIVYTSKEGKAVKEIKKIISSLPENLLANLKEIKLIPAKHKSNAAGITKYNKIFLYKISNYSKTTLKNIVIHEIAHTWSYVLMQNKIIDFSYSDYQNVIKNDKRFPSTYAKENVKAGDYSEDFAESISFYLINTKSFNKKFPSRAEYIKNIINM